MQNNVKYMRLSRIVIIVLFVFCISGCILKSGFWGNLRIVQYDFADYDISKSYQYYTITEPHTWGARVGLADSVLVLNYIFEGNYDFDTASIKNYILNFMDTVKRPEFKNQQIEFYKTSLTTDREYKGIDGDIPKEDHIGSLLIRDGKYELLWLMVKDVRPFYRFHYNSDKPKLLHRDYWLEKTQ